MPPESDLNLRIDSSWQRFHEQVEKIGPEALDEKTPTGWTVAEMLAHVAFWDECVEPVIEGMFRGAVELHGWTFGSGWSSTGPEWPQEDVHNAREAEWARGRSAEKVLARLDGAHAQAGAVFATVTSEELSDPRFVQFLGDQAAHYDEHLPELQALR